MKLSRFVSSCSLLPFALTCATCFALAPSVAPIGIDDFSGMEQLIVFGGTSTISDSLTVNGVVFNDETEGFLQFQEGGTVPDVLFSNTPGASKGGYGRTIAAGLLKMLIELPSPARRFGMLLSAGGPKSYQVSAIRDGLSLGTIIATQPGQNQAVFAGIESSLPFQQIRIEQIFSGGFSASAFDDVRYEIAPEPASLTLLCLGSVCLLRRR